MLVIRQGWSAVSKISKTTTLRSTVRKQCTLLLQLLAAKAVMHTATLRTAPMCLLGRARSVSARLMIHPCPTTHALPCPIHRGWAFNAYVIAPSQCQHQLPHQLCLLRSWDLEMGTKQVGLQLRQQCLAKAQHPHRHQCQPRRQPQCLHQHLHVPRGLRVLGVQAGMQGGWLQAERRRQRQVLRLCHLALGGLTVQRAGMTQV
mmetsp:Transcript_1341/g.3596  ORF Transcript_1341/g.3596 Transcript_1341/m.3596 type:complete len:203 (+) Transcript_1341:2546-3154(+)